MTRIRTTALSLIVVGVLAAGLAGPHAYAQAPAPAAPPPAASAPAAPAQGAGTTAANDVTKWTRKKWNEMKAKWVQEKEKWADCHKKSVEQKLRGRKSWSFIASCMTS